MGIDWCLEHQIARPGNEEEYRRLTAKLKHLAKDERLSQPQRTVLAEDLESALKTVALSAYEAMGAPRLGFDAAADDWFKKHVYELAQVQLVAEKKKPNALSDGFIQFWDRPVAEVLKHHHGKYVVELARDAEGIPAITGFFASQLDFRGQAVATSNIIDRALQAEAFDNHSGDGAADYADRLELAVMQFKVRRPDWQTGRVVDESGRHVDALEDVRDVESAVRWLRYWGTRGFAFSAWY
ncbi:MAG: hypothetical protein QM723_27620 [Myxococcaceae bacterium]